MSVEKAGGIAVLAKETTSLRPGFTGGYSCATCKAKLQASPRVLGLEKQRSKIMFFCNRCGTIAATILAGTGRVESVEFSPEVMNQLEGMKARAEGKN